LKGLFLEYAKFQALKNAYQFDLLNLFNKKSFQVKLKKNKKTTTSKHHGK